MAEWSLRLLEEELHSKCRQMPFTGCSQNTSNKQQQQQQCRNCSHSKGPLQRFRSPWLGTEFGSSGLSIGTRRVFLQENQRKSENHAHRRIMRKKTSSLSTIYCFYWSRNL